MSIFTTFFTKTKEEEGDQNRLPEAISTSHPLPGNDNPQSPIELEDVLKAAVSSWEQGDEVAVWKHLKTAISLAAQQPSCPTWLPSSNKTT